MGVVGIRRRYGFLLERPNTPFRLNLASPQANGLIAWVPIDADGTPRDHVSGNILKPPTGLGVAPSMKPVPLAGGMGTRHVTGSVAYYAEAITEMAYTMEHAGSSALPVTMACWCVPLDAGAASLSVCSFGNNSAGLSLGTSAGGTWAVVGNGVATGPDSGLAPVPNQLTLVAMRKGPFNNLVDIWINGVSKGTPATLSSTVGLTSLSIGTRNSVGNIRGSVFHFAIWNRAMSDNEMFSLWDPSDRWDLYDPITKYFIFFTPTTAVQGTGNSDGLSTATAVGAATTAQAGTSAGTGAATGVGASTNRQAGTAAGTSTATGVSASTVASAGASDGTGTASGAGAAVAAGVGSAAGTSTAAAIGAASGAGVGTAAGTSTVAAVGASTAEGTGAAAAAGVASGVGADVAEAIGTASGTGSASAVGHAIVGTVGTASGTSTASAVGRDSVTHGVGTAGGTSTATGVGRAIGPGRISQFVEEYADGQAAAARVTGHALEYADGAGAAARVTGHAVEVANGQPANVQVTAFVIEIAYRRGSVTPVTPPFPGWSTCPTEDPTVAPGRGDGLDAGFAWECPPTGTVQPPEGRGDGLGPDDLPFKWGNC